MKSLQQQILTHLEQFKAPIIGGTLREHIISLTVEKNTLHILIELPTQYMPNINATKETLYKAYNTAASTLPGRSFNNIEISMSQHIGRYKISSTTSKHANKVNVPGVKNILVVVSGKGGVGKSTIATALAISLARLNNNVGLLDADIYGPSIPNILGIKEKPDVTASNVMLPIKKHGISTMSIGMLVEEGQAVIWRGPMLTKALHQLLMTTEWQQEKPIDYLIIDTPPGTGDLHLSLFSRYRVDAAVVVSTPQLLALNDAKRTVQMLQKFDIRILGIIENMSYLITDGKPLYPLGKSKVGPFAREQSLKILPHVPIAAVISEAGDCGKLADLCAIDGALNPVYECAKYIINIFNIKSS